MDCIGHVQKRMGTHLRELRKKQPKLKDGKSVKGSEYRLIDKTLDKLQTYYGNAIRANVKPGKLTPQEQKKTNKNNAKGYTGSSQSHLRTSR